MKKKKESNVLETVIRNCPTKKSPGPDVNPSELFRLNYTKPCKKN
jgi:hypothetical protein